MKKNHRNRPLNGQKLAKRLFKSQKNKIKKSLKGKEEYSSIDLLSLRPYGDDLPELQ